MAAVRPGIVAEPFARVPSPDGPITETAKETVVQKISVTMIDDLDGESEATETVAFSIRGKKYEVDFSKEHAAEFDELFARYVAAARAVSGRGGSSTASRSNAGRRVISDRQRSADIRTWAKERGIQVATRGRIPASVTEQYDAAH